MFWLPLGAVLFSPVPVTVADVAFELLHVMVQVPGAVHVVGLALMEAATDATVLTVNVAVCVVGPPDPWAIIV